MNPFEQYQLRFKRTEREFLTEAELSAIEIFSFVNSSLQEVKDLFVFSCYTGLSSAEIKGNRLPQTHCYFYLAESVSYLLFSSIIRRIKKAGELDRTPG